MFQYSNAKINLSWSKYLVLLICFSLFSCSQHDPTPMDLMNQALIPLPRSIEATGSSFNLEEKTEIFFSDKKLQANAEAFAQFLGKATGFKIKTGLSSGPVRSGNIYMQMDNTIENPDAYELGISENSIELKAGSPAGNFYGIQTLRQLLPSEIESDSVQPGPWEIASGNIVDAPEYSYRGAMLDVARHFFEVRDVKKYIDYLAMYKMNVLHLHLADDQGWRIEIKSWPKLTEIGGSTEVGGGKGGFYTQEQYADIVKYAADRFITIIPEIDMPGHTNAALASYAELNCDGKARELYTGTEVGFSTLCTDKEITYQFVDDVIKELAAMTPGPYIHVGGDESHVTDLNDYIPFINRVQEIVKKHDKIMIGWDEVTEADLASTSIAQYWAKAENAQAAVKKGAKVIMSPAAKAYLDMQYDSTTRIGLHWASYIEVDAGYNWDPATLVEGVSKADILGIEAPLWSETVTNLEDIQYLVFPRLLGYAEIGWTNPAERNWEEYKVRLGKQSLRFEQMGINYYRSKLVPWVEREVQP